MPMPEVPADPLPTQPRQSNLEAVWNAQDARFLVQGLGSLMMATGLLLFAIYLSWRGPELRNSFSLWMACLGLLIFLAARHGHTRLAISLALWGFWALLCAWGFLIAGVRTPVIAGAPLFIMLAGWLVGLRSAMLMALATTLVLTAMLWAESAGYLASAVSRQPGDYYLSLLTMCLLGGYVAGYFGNSFRKQYAELQTSSQALLAQNEALRLSEERFAQFFRTNPLPSMVTRTADGLICEVNTAWELDFGWKADEVRGKTTLEIGFWESPQERAYASALVSEETGTLAHAFRFRQRDGTVRSYLVSLTRTTLDGELRTVASMLDQTERLRNEEAIRELNASLEAQVAKRTADLSEALETLNNTHRELLQAEKLASLGSLVAGISHELNTPIGNALTTASALHERARQFSRMTEERQLKKSAFIEFLQSTEQMSDLLERSCNRAAELIASFKQIAVDQTTERRRSFELHVLVDDVINTLRPSFRTAPWQVRTEIAPEIRCDSYPGPLAQVLTNLVQNAFLHAFDGRANGEVIVRGRLTEKGEVELSVQDNGCGMEAAVATHIFDPFFTTRLGKGGSGLGLSISHQIATAVLGGNLQVATQPGLGSTFKLNFPSRAPSPNRA